MTRNEAYRKLHFPDTLEEAEEARRRIAFDDFVRLQVFLLNSKQNQTDKRQGITHTKHSLSQKFVDSLPFTLTGAQKRVSVEIAEDMALAKPMLRLLHGEVSSGKTEVSTIAILNAVESKTQVAFLAPTTILAEQLYERFVRDMKRANITSKQVRPALFHNGVKLSERKKILEQLAEGEINVLIGTHSILSKTLQENYTLASEVTPDVLMMSATPIPRTMAQTIYGDMEISVIDELPGERKPVFTYWEEDESEVWTAIREQVNEGHQAYVIAALVEESESERLEDVENATSTQAFLQTSVFPEFRLSSRKNESFRKS
jgi:ATP-dependent DNA helicase RecG